MHKKTAAFILSFLVAISFLSSKTLALELTSIGALDTSGKTYTEWWYTGLTPLIKGTATAGASVSWTVGEKTGSTAADSAGIWSFTPGTLEAKDYPVSIKSEGKTVSFTLHAGQIMPAGTGTAATGTQVTQTGGTGAPVPETGSNQLIGVLFTLIAVLSSFHIYFTGRERAINYFEHRVSNIS
jgi:hypothetical protein